MHPEGHTNSQPGGAASQSLAALLRRYRRAGGLTQEELADSSGLSARAIADIERGRTSRPYRSSVRALADALNLSDDERELLIRASKPRGADPRPTPRSGATADAAPNAEPGTVIPRQLPPVVAHFVGRRDEIDTLNNLRASHPGTTVVICAIAGTAGVGKTALALHWAHQVADRFGDGQLYVNLRGYDPGRAVTTADALAGFLRALGVPGQEIPAGADERAARYRSMLASARMLIVLDNAADEQQVRPLLPASPASLVLVTSRRQLNGLAAADGAHLVSLDVLSQTEAVQMLTARLGAARAAAEPAAMADLADLCARLPLALAVAAARAAARPRFPLAALAAELADTAGPLDALEDDDPATSMRAVFSWSTRQLSEESARMFRLLGLHPGPDVAIAAAASLVGCTRQQARQMLRELARAHLITEHVRGRYAFHELLRAYAADQARALDSQDDRDAAIGRVLDHYLHTAARAALLLDPSKEPTVLAPPRLGAAAEQPADYAQAMAWFEAEHQVLLAAVTLCAGNESDTYAWQLAWAMTNFLFIRGHWQERAAIQCTALAAATRLGNAAAQALCGRLLANACTNVGDHARASRHYATSLKLYQQLGNRLGEAKVQHSLGLLADTEGRYEAALDHSEQSLRLFQAVGDKRSEANMLNNVGWYHGLLGDYERARVFCQRSLALYAITGDRWVARDVWDSLGYAEHHLGNLAEAAACYQRALTLNRETGDRFGEADILAHLGDTLYAAGDKAQARQAWQHALDILDDLRHPNADEVRDKLARATSRSDTAR